MTDLSPAAQAVLDAYHQEAIDYIEDWGTFSHKRGLAAALEAVADEVVPERQEPAEPPGYGCGSEPPEYVGQWTCWNLRNQILAIAAELRPTTTQENN